MGRIDRWRSGEGRGDPPALLVDALESLRTGTNPTDPPGGNRGPIVVIGPSEVPGWVGEGVGPAEILQCTGLHGQPVSPACVVELSWDTARSSELGACLEHAYAHVAVGGLLLLRISHPGARAEGPARKWPRASATRAERTLPDLVATALFRAGFVDPRLVPDHHGGYDVLARRGAAEPPTRRRHLLSVVMPVYNEVGTFGEVAKALLAKEISGVDIEVIIVESNSTDGSRDAVKAVMDHPRVTAIFEERPKGKGHAVRAGLAEARGDFVLIQDADLEYSLDDYDELLEPLRTFEASFVLGARSSPAGTWGMRHFDTQVLVSRLMNVGHVGFLALFNAVYRQKLADPFTMYKVFRRDCIFGMRLECDRFDFDWELTAKLIRAGYTPLEKPVAYASRSFSQGKKVRLVGDPWSWIVACARYRFAPLHEDLSAPPWPSTRPSSRQARS